MNTPWYHHSENPEGITFYYDAPPPLENAIVREFDGSAYFDQCSIRLWLDLAFCPQSMPEGSTFSIGLSFCGLSHLAFLTRSKSSKLATDLKIDRIEDGLRVIGSGSVEIDLTCQSFMIESVGASDPNERAERRRALTSYRQLWNSCLIELMEMGYELALFGPPDPDGNAHDCSFTATKGSVRLAGRNPVELIGLATLECRFPDFGHQSELWERPGPNLINKLTEDWCESWRKPKS